MFRRIFRVLSILLIAGAVLIAADIAWQIWGTAWQQRQSQAHLRSELNKELKSSPDSPTITPSKNSTTSDPPLLSSQKEPIPAVGQPIGTILIPAINVNLVIVQGTNAPQLSEGPGHYLGTPLPGQPGNVAIAGHRTTYGAPFYDINALTPGDPIYITTPYGKFTYLVTSSEVVSPNDSAVLDSTSNQHTLTLTTCNPRYSETSRLVVSAREQS